MPLDLIYLFSSLKTELIQKYAVIGRVARKNMAKALKLKIRGRSKEHKM